MSRIRATAVVGAVSVALVAIWLLRGPDGERGWDSGAAMGIQALPDPTGTVEPVPAMEANPFVVREAAGGEEHRIDVAVRTREGPAPPLGMEVEVRVQTDDEPRMSHPLDALGTCRIRGIAATHKVWLRLRDAYGYVVQSEMVLPGPASERIVRWTLPDPCRTVAGQVIDARGRAVPGVSLSIEVERVRSRSFAADAQGRFRLEGICSAAPVLVFWSPGSTVSVVPAPALFAREVFVLEEGRTVRFEVVDADGSPIDAGIECLVAGGSPPQAIRRSPGVFDIEHAPAGQFSVHVTRSGKILVTRIPAGETSVRCQAPN